MSTVRPLPPVPNLEYERKQAKELLRRLRAGEPGALARWRAHHPANQIVHPAQARLADAQLVIAREYGFASWPRLVRYFRDVDRQRHSHRSMCRSDFYEGCVRMLIAEHRQRRVVSARALASYVPRFYGLRVEDIFAAAISEDDARLAVARTYGFPRWDQLMERAQAERRRRSDKSRMDLMRQASKAMANGALGELRRLVEAHPDLLRPPELEVAMGSPLLRMALDHERKRGREAMRPIVDWLVAQGLDIQQELGRQLCGHVRMVTEDVRWLLDRGADPTGSPPTASRS